MKYIVYRTTNLVNGKIYVGVHGTLDPNVFDGYLGCNTYASRPSTYNNESAVFKRAVKKYGPENFVRETLYVYDNREEAYLKEKEIVNEEFISRSDTYNICLGGLGGNFNEKPLYQFDTEGNLIKKWDSSFEALQFYHIKSYHNLETCLQFKERMKGFYWSRDENIDISLYSKGRMKAKKVYKYSGETLKCIAEYDSINQASKENYINRTNLSCYIRSKSLINGFYFSDVYMDKFILPKRLSLRNRLIYLYDNEGKLIGKYTIKELDEQYHISYASVYRAIKISKGRYKDYLISLDDLGEYLGYSLVCLCKSHKINVYTAQHEYINTYNSLTSLSNELHIPTSTINRVLKGLSKTTHGYILEEVNDIV